VVKSQASGKRSEKRCCLTDQGLQLLEKAISSRDKEKQSNAQLAADAGCDRGTISKIRNGKDALNLSSIFALFSALDLDLADEHWQEWQKDAASQSTDQSRNRQPEQLQSSSVPTKAEQVANLLWSLNCDDQENSFKNRCKLPERSHLFLVQVPDERIQRWLVKRFIHKYHSANPYQLNVRSHPMRFDFSEVWQEFANRLKLSTAAPEVVLQCLCDLAQTKPIFIAVFGLHQSEVRDRFLQEFWVRLCEKFCAETTRSIKSKLVLFLIEEPQARLFESFQDVHSFSPLTEISGADVTDWIQLKSVYELLSQTIGEDKLERLVQSDLPSWNTEPYLMIDKVCFAFGLKNGIAEIESYWELAG
jgi:transcriptional regulator with XRE-family HTH domain